MHTLDSVDIPMTNVPHNLSVIFKDDLTCSDYYMQQIITFIPKPALFAVKWLIKDSMQHAQQRECY